MTSKRKKNYEVGFSTSKYSALFLARSFPSPHTTRRSTNYDFFFPFFFLFFSHVFSPSFIFALSVSATRPPIRTESTLRFCGAYLLPTYPILHNIQFRGFTRKNLTNQNSFLFSVFFPLFFFFSFLCFSHNKFVYTRRIDQKKFSLMFCTSVTRAAVR